MVDTERLVDTFVLRDGPLQVSCPRRLTREEFHFGGAGEMRRYEDGKRVTFAEYRDLLPSRAADFPNPNRVDDSVFLSEYRCLWDHCQVCGAGVSQHSILEVHHLFAGRKGRSDEPCGVMMVCRDCHDEYGPQSSYNVGLLLWRKWKTDHQSTDWVRSALLHARFLPDLVEDKGLDIQYMKRQKLLVPWGGKGRWGMSDYVLDDTTYWWRWPKNQDGH